MIRVNLIGLPKVRKRARAPLVTMEGGSILIVLGVVVLAVVAAEYWRYHSLQQKVGELDQQIAALEGEARELRQIQGEVDAFTKKKDLLTKHINIIEGLKAKQAGPVQLLNAVASAAVGTDSLWLTAFTQAGQNVTIEGVALNVKAVADFITRLINSKAFSTVDLKETAQDTTDRTIEKFVFTVNGQLPAPAPTT